MLKNDPLRSPAERETILRTAADEKVWVAWTCNPTDYNTFQKQGWRLKKEIVEGEYLVEATFEAPRSAISIRKFENRHKLTEEQREAARQRMITYHKNKA